MTQMIQWFLGMALWGSVVSIVVLLVRPIIKKRSNRIMCLLWLVVMFRFLCPFAIERPVPVMHTENTQAVSSEEALEETEADTETIQNNQDFGYASEGSAIRNLQGKAGTQFAIGTDDNVTALASDAAAGHNEMQTGNGMTGSAGSRETSGMTAPKAVQTAKELANPNAVQTAKELANPNAVRMKSETNDSDAKQEESAESSSVKPFLVYAMEFVKESLDNAGARFMFCCFSAVWFLGAALFLAMGIRRYYRIAKVLREAIYFKRWDHYPVSISDVSGVPMAFGILHPGIYVPASFDENTGIANDKSFSDKQKKMILWHESMHLKRHDPLWKFVTLVMVAIHWWNPLAWICMKCINQDIEMACDEMVLAHIGQKNREEYAKTLLDFATRQSGISVMASFGESHAENRIKNALKYRRSPLWITIVTSALVLALGGCLALKPVAEGKRPDPEAGEEQNMADSDAAEVEEDQKKVQSEPLWVHGGADYITTFPLGQEEARLRIWSTGKNAYFELMKNDTHVGHGTLVKWYEDESQKNIHYDAYPIYKIDEIGYADINFDQVNDLILIGETLVGKCVYIVESENGILEKDDANERWIRYMDTLSNSVEELFEERPTVKAVKDILFGQDYDGTFQTYQDAYEVVARIQNMKGIGSSYNLIYFNDDDIPDLVIGWVGYQLFIFEGGKVYRSNVLEGARVHDCNYIERLSIACPGEGLDEGHEYDYLQMDPDHSVRKVCGYRVESEASGEKEAQLTYLDYSDENLSQDEIKKKIEGYQEEQKNAMEYEATCGEFMYRLGKLPDVHESIASYITIADTSHTIDFQGYPNLNVSKDSLYERFKNDNEKVYFDRYDGYCAQDAPNFDCDGGYTLLNLIDTVWLHYLGYFIKPCEEPEDLKMQIEFAYLDCGQDGDPEMAIEFRNLGRYGSLVLVIKEVNGKLQCTYGYETWDRSDTMINTAGILCGTGSSGFGRHGYDLGMLDANAEYHLVYSFTSYTDYDESYDESSVMNYFPNCEDNIYWCSAWINGTRYTFYVSNDPKLSSDELFNTMKKHDSSEIDNAKEVAKIREQTKESYGITEEMLGLDPLFGYEYYGKEMMEYVSGRALGWD